MLLRLQLDRLAKRGEVLERVEARTVVMALVDGARLELATRDKFTGKLGRHAKELGDLRERKGVGRAKFDAGRGIGFHTFKKKTGDRARFGTGHDALAAMRLVPEIPADKRTRPGHRGTAGECLRERRRLHLLVNGLGGTLARHLGALYVGARGVGDAVQRRIVAAGKLGRAVVKKRAVGADGNHFRRRIVRRRRACWGVMRGRPP